MTKMQNILLIAWEHMVRLNNQLIFDAMPFSKLARMALRDSSLLMKPSSATKTKTTIKPAWLRSCPNTLGPNGFR
jgi:hypothetical protein